MREIQKGTTFTRNEATSAQRLFDLGCLQQCKIHLECEPCILCMDLRSDLRNWTLKVSKSSSWWREKRQPPTGRVLQENIFECSTQTKGETLQILSRTEYP